MFVCSTPPYQIIPQTVGYCLNLEFKNILSPNKLSTKITFSQATTYTQWQPIFGCKHCRLLFLNLEELWNTSSTELTRSPSGNCLVGHLFLLSPAFQISLWPCFTKPPLNEISTTKTSSSHSFPVELNLKQDIVSQSGESLWTSETRSLHYSRSHEGFRGCDSYEVKPLIAGNAH